MALIFTFLLIAGLEIASANDETVPDPTPAEAPKESDLCVDCDDESPPTSPETIIIEIQIDPVAGDVQYIIKGIVVHTTYFL